MLDKFKVMRKAPFLYEEKLTINNLEIVDAISNPKLLYVKVHIYGRELYGLVDTGATLSAISVSAVNELKF